MKFWNKCYTEKQYFDFFSLRPKDQDLTGRNSDLEIKHNETVFLQRDTLLKTSGLSKTNQFYTSAVITGFRNLNF